MSTKQVNQTDGLILKYVTVHPNGEPFLYLISDSREQAVMKFLRNNRQEWSYYKARGYSVRKIVMELQTS